MIIAIFIYVDICTIIYTALQLSHFFIQWSHQMDTFIAIALIIIKMNEDLTQKITQPNITVGANSSQSIMKDINYTRADLNKGMGYMWDIEKRVRQLFINPMPQPYYFCSYTGFAKVFPAPNINEAYKSENLNIIDLHLRYHQYIHEKLALYKWGPSLLMALVFRLNAFSLVFPVIHFALVDRYFKNFLIWKYSDDKIINVRSEFVTKLSKRIDGLRRVMLFTRLKQFLRDQNDDVPLKYIKFGENTHYVFHSLSPNSQQSSLHLTPLFQNYMWFRYLSIEAVRKGWVDFKNTISQFKTYKKLPNKDQMPIFINIDKLIKYKDIKQEEVYNLSKKIELRVQRLFQLYQYIKSGKIYISGFTFSDVVHMNKHYDLLAPQKYNLESNAPDLVMFYSTVLTLKLLKFIIKRSVKM